MKVSGFSFVKNAVIYGYPVTESIQSILPLVDEMIICLGDSEDETEALIRSIPGEKIRIIHSVWDPELRTGGKVLAAETNKALAATASDSDWLFYIQADEVVHEEDHAAIKAAMEKYLPDKETEGLLFNYRHFYGSYKYLGDGRSWYTKEIRVIRNNKKIISYRDAQGFRWEDNRKLKVRQINAGIFHYGWVRNPVKMHRKMANFGRLYNPNVGPTGPEEVVFDYSTIDSVVLYKGTHPALMKELIGKEDWDFNRPEKEKNFKNIKHRFLYFLAEKIGWRPFAYRNYKRI